MPEIKKFELKGTRKVVIEVSYKEIQRVIVEFYQLPKTEKYYGPYEITAMEEWSNGEEHTFDLDGDIDEDEIQEALELMETKKPEQFTTRTYLQYMVKVGALEPGSYLVSVYW